MIEVLKSVNDLSRQNWDVLVPTMGALHAGHESLIKLAKAKGNQVIVSIFVNPLQFENKEDLLNYPKTIDSDLKIAAGAGASAVFLPEESLIYPTGYKTIEAGGVGEIYEGKSRPGHFSGVLTVVNRLFDLVKPKSAIFGEKDFQQLFLIKQMAKKLALAVEILSAPTIRDTHGVALSSRNSKLGNNGIQTASIIYRALSLGNLERARKVIKSEPEFKVDYLELIDANTFDLAKEDTENKRLIIAGWINQVRLIDNMAMGSK